MVWLKDVTTSLHSDKRIFSDPNLPDILTFQLRGGSRALTLNLERNYAIDPNAEVYIVSKSNDGRFQLEKALNFEKESLVILFAPIYMGVRTSKYLLRYKRYATLILSVIEDRN
ncbi:hypothetical protein CHS0354_020223 [Potamilus streckersoni]|uniref:Uncharacterized protein n=1 Tax=Potamilus streckersoni TaxID=2493646 RepID=A0AAE0VWR3_9BIVA|nr:hypothetical protein CHS0354_020223 [Potamilus streckersoni]